MYFYYILCILGNNINIIIFKIIKSSLGTSIIFCDFFVFILMQKNKYIFQKNRLSFYFILIIFFGVLLVSSSAIKLNLN